MDAWQIPVTHISLATLFFFLLNWIGRHSVSLGYMQLSVFAKNDEAPAFNFILKTVSPTVFIILVSSIFYAYGLDRLVENIWLVAVYYCALRFLFNAALERLTLINWRMQVAQWVVSIGLSYFAYEKIISVRINLLPDFSTISNELWIVVLFYLYTVMNNIKISDEGTRRRKDKYVRKRLSEFSQLYGESIRRAVDRREVERLVYAILLYENFARPRAVRAVENLIPNGIEATRGVMQVKSPRKLSDSESVELAAERINSAYKLALDEARVEVDDFGSNFPASMRDNAIENRAVRAAIANYNKDDDYIREVRRLYESLEPALEDGSAQ